MSERKPLDHKGRQVRAEMRTTASPGEVWAAWADPAHLQRWFPDRADGEAREGGSMRYSFDRFHYDFPYRVLVAEPGERLALYGELGDRSGILEVVIEKAGGETVLRLVNSGFREGAEWDDEYEGVDSGWKVMMAVLKLYLEQYFGKPRAQAFHMRPAAFEYDKLPPYYLTAGGLTRWLALSASIGGVGAPCRLELIGGGTLTGHVLEITRRETLVRWNEIDGVLAFKAFGMGPKRMLALHAMGWNLAPEIAAAIENNMVAALDRLAGIVES